MRNLVLIAAKGDIHDHVKTLWRTDIFRQSHETGGFIHTVVDRFARLPRFFSEMSDITLERAHFSVWWSGLQPRQYEKAACNDFFLLHEMAHGADMMHMSGISAENFKRKMVDNELYASVMSEIYAYFALPGSRAMTFSEEIFADRFLNDAMFQTRMQEDPERLLTELCYRRREAMFNPAPGDAIEQWLNRFTAQNDDWFDIWQKNYGKVETAMERLTRLSLAGARQDALLRHVDWLYSKEVMGTGDIPFREEAAAFADIYWKNRAESMVQKAA